MCGIAGIVAPAAERFGVALRQMTDSLSHRGPDGEGHYYFPGCALGHRRLSIVDLGTGAQPMLAADAPLGVTFNGEIYGYREIRAGFPDYPFRTISDTEVILALYERHGRDFLQYLPGMFAFAIWDERRQELVCARDRFGEKPFYYAFGPDGEFLFASEIKALLASGLIRPVVDRQSVAHYLQYLYVPPGRTIYRNVFTLPPAHRLNYQAGKLTVERYWHLPLPQPRMDAIEAVGEFRRLLNAAVARQLVADVPIGTFLSGGLDSSTIVAVAAKHQARLKTFAFGFGASTSELPFARSVAQRYATDHTELTDSGSDIADLLVAMQDVYDEPFADSSNIPTYLIAKLARQHVAVVLTGDGGDELFGGYTSWYRPLLQMSQVNQPQTTVAALLRMVGILARRSGFPLPSEWGHAIQGRYLASRFTSITAAHCEQQTVFHRNELAELGFVTADAAPLKIIGPKGTVDDAMRLDLEGYLPGDILVKIDRASMANSLELRAPFLDNDFASFCISLPWQLKITSKEDKSILRKAYAAAWPVELHQRGKQGFGAPVGEWLDLPRMREIKAVYLENPCSPLYSIIPFTSSQPFVRQNSYRTWALLVLALWLDRYKPELG